jgi:hypothetical protein
VLPVILPISLEMKKKITKEENDKCPYYAEFAFLKSHSPLQ